MMMLLSEPAPELACLFLCIVCFVSRKWCLCRVTHKAVWRCLLRGEVWRSADRLHEPLLLHKRTHVLSNCQNSYFKGCDRPAVRGSPWLLCLRCTSVCVLCTSWHVCSDIRVCTRPSGCVLHECVRIWAFLHVRAHIFRMSASFWQTFDSDPFHWSLQLSFCASVDLITGNMPGQEEKKNCYTSWGTMTASLPREALEGSLGLQLANALNICNCALQLLVGVSELWFV